MNDNLCIERVCKAKAGRGKNRYFIIYGIVNEEYVLLTDGATRKLERPKLKKKKHLLCRPYVATEIAEAIEKGAPLLDAEIRNALDRITAIEISKEK